MGFTTSSFIFFFLPISLVLFYFLRIVTKKSSKRQVMCDVLLVALSIVFYAWAFVPNAALLLLYCLIVYVIGKIIHLSNNRKNCLETNKAAYIGLPWYSKKGEKDVEKHIFLIKISALILVLGLSLLIIVLYHYKYETNILSFVNKYIPSENGVKSISAPLGISFITFSAITYLVDIYKGEKTGSFLDCILYLTFFPKVVSGPIVAWKDFRKGLANRFISNELFVEGINRICIGFAKKVILADTFGLYLSKFTGTAESPIAIDTQTAWLGWLLYALQIYYDFAGYSDIAIGVSKLFGFNFNENFNFPYRSLSITEFWRRWHISLGSFFKNYVYIPLGGNRKGYRRTLINLAVVFLITGIWHGAGLAYILWGIIHGICELIERVLKDKQWYVKIPAFIKWAITFFIVSSAWELFRFGNVVKAFKWFEIMVGKAIYGIPTLSWHYYLDNHILLLIVIGILGATLLGDRHVIAAYDAIKNKPVVLIFRPIILLALLLTSFLYMVSSSYSPFIYFQF